MSHANEGVWGSGAVPEAAQLHPLTEAVDPQPTMEVAELQSTNAAVSSTGGFSDAELGGPTPKEMQAHRQATRPGAGGLGC